MADHPADDEIGHAQGAARLAPAHATADVGRHADFGRVRGRCLRSSSGASSCGCPGSPLRIATFGLLGVVNNVYSNWDSVTGGQGSIVGTPATHELLDRMAGRRGRDRDRVSLRDFPLPAWRFAPPATRQVAASASGIDIVRERLIAFAVSAFIIGLAGALYAHFLSIVNPRLVLSAANDVHHLV